MSTTRELRCGCRLCGCMCAEHAPDGVEQVCAVHLDRAVLRFIGEEAVRLVAISLFVAGVLAWAAIFSV